MREKCPLSMYLCHQFDEYHLNCLVCLRGLDVNLIWECMLTTAASANEKKAGFDSMMSFKPIRQVWTRIVTEMSIKKLELKNSLIKTLYRNSCHFMHASIQSFYGLNPQNESLVDLTFHFSSFETMLSFFLDVRSYCGLSWNDMTVCDSSGQVVGQRRGGCTHCLPSPSRLS